MARTIEVILYPKFTREDLEAMLRLNYVDDDSIKLSNGFTACALRDGTIEVKVVEKSFEVTNE
jgi:hypothetical protein